MTKPPTTGRVSEFLVINSMSESKGAIGISIKTTARDVCSIHKYAHWDGLKNGKLDRNQFCIGGFIGTSEHRLTDMAIRAFAWGIQLNLLKTNEVTIQDVTGASNPETANTAISAVNLHAGSGVTAAVFTRFAVESPLTNTGSTAYAAFYQRYFWPCFYSYRSFYQYKRRNVL